jgi:hypothetical protein
MLKIGAHVIINEEDISFAKLKSNKKQSSNTNNDKLALIAKDGSYKIIGATFKGDTYGTDWYSEIICLDVDATVNKVARGRAMRKAKGSRRRRK